MQPTPGGPTRLVVGGEVDYEAVDEFQEAAQAALAASGGRGVILDLSGVTFLESTGVGALVRIWKSCAERRASLVLERPSERVVSVLELTGLVGFFDIDLSSGDSSPG
jgi:anti-anti-sigma factor